jgi:cytosine/adenosine deaminase-related metal-dependent hydrolase
VPPELSRRNLLGGALGAPAATIGPSTRERRPETPAALRLTGAQVLTPHGVQDSEVLVRDGVVAEVAATVEPNGAETIDLTGRLLAPGLVDTHWHAWNTALRGWSTSSLGGFAATMAAFSPHVTPDDAAIGVRLALAEAVAAGVTTVHDWAHNTRSPEHAEAELAAMETSGVRGRFAYGYPQDATPGTTMDLDHLAELARRPRRGTTSLGICSRGPDRSDPAVWRAEWEAARGLGLPISTHLASDAAAAALGGVRTLAAAGGLGPDVQVVHLTGASVEELRTVADAGSPVSISPWTELEVGYGIPPVAALAESGVRLGLSIDNTVLAGSVDMFRVMALTADLAAGGRARQSVVADATVLHWATAGGAASLGFDDVGTIAVGQRADLVAVRTDVLGGAPVSTPEFFLTHTARPADVDLVLVDGVVHKRDGRLTRVDVGELLEEARRSAERLCAAAGVQSPLRPPGRRPADGWS